MRRSSLAAACLLVMLLPLPPTLAQGPSIAQTIAIDVQPDGSERIRVSVDGTQAFPAGIRLRGIEVTGVHSGSAPIPYDTERTSAGDVLVKPQGKWFHYVVEGRRGPANDPLHPIHVGSFSAAEFGGVANRIRVSVQLPEGHVLLRAHPGTISSDGRSSTHEATAGFDLVYVSVAPMPNGTIAIDEGVFHLVGPEDREPQMRTIARIATRGISHAAAHAGLALHAPLVVRFAPASAFGWEGGSYRAEGLISMRVDGLEPWAAGGYPYLPAASLTHEAFHAISIPHGRGAFGGDATWWVEGAARYAEQFVTGDDGWIACEEHCYRWEPHLLATELAAMYESNWSLDPGWSNDDPHSDLDRKALYDRSGFVVAAFVAQAGEDAYRRAWQRFIERANAATCACDAALLEALILEGTDLSRAQLYAPYRALWEEDRAAFAAATAPLVGNGARDERPTPRTADGVASGTTGWTPSLAEAEPFLRARSPTGVTLAVAFDGFVPVPTNDHLPLDDRPRATLAFTTGNLPANATWRREGDTLLVELPIDSGPHWFRLEAWDADAVEPRRLALLETPLNVPPRYHVALDETPAQRVEALVTDGPGGAPLPDVELTFHLDGGPVLVGLTDATGRLTMDAPRAPGEHDVRVVARYFGQEVTSAERTVVVASAPVTPSPPATPSPTPVSPSDEAPTVSPAPAERPVPALATWLALGAVCAFAWVRRRP